MKNVPFITLASLIIIILLTAAATTVERSAATANIKSKPCTAGSHRYDGQNLNDMRPTTVRTTHAPIIIMGDAEFTSGNGVTGGTGTPHDPYVIENYDIDAASADGIRIENTSAHVVIRNCHIYNGVASGNCGVRMSNVANAEVTNNLVETCLIGASIKGERLRVCNNTVRNNSYIGMYFTEVKDTLVWGNNGRGNSHSDLYFVSSSYNMICFNGIHSGGGQGMVISCAGTNLVSHNFYYNSGLDASCSVDHIISDNVFNASKLTLQQFATSSVENNTFSGVSEWAISSDITTNSKIAGNRIVGFGVGIRMSNASGNRVFCNNVSDCQVGLTATNVSYTDIFMNEFRKNSGYAVSMSADTYYNRICKNNFAFNRGSGTTYDSSSI